MEESLGSATRETLVEIKDLRFSRGDRMIFDGLSLSIRRGQVVALLGPSGTGKTTLLKLIMGQLTPESGSIKVAGKEVRELSRDRLFDLRKKMGLLFQSGALLTDYNAFDNVALPIREHTNLPESLIGTLVMIKLQAVGLRGAARLMPSELSGGMARRVALARAIALDPDLVLYDEPFAGLDPISLGAIRTLVRNLNDALGLASVVVTHNLRALDVLADHAYIISGGKVIGHGSPNELMESESDFVRQFVHGLPDGPVPFHIPASPVEEAFLGPKQ